MTDLQIIKKRIYEENKIEYLLHELGCTHVKYEQGGKLLTAKLPDAIESENSRSVQVYNRDSLTSYIRSKSVSGDIFHIVQYINGCELFQAKFWICNILGYDIDSDYQPKKDWNKKLHEIQNKRNKFCSQLENIPLQDSILQQFSNIPSYEWWTEGLHYQTQKQFEVMLDGSNGADKIVFPIRDENNKIVTVKARFTHEFEKEHKDMKYFYLYPYNRQLTLYNLNNVLNITCKEIYIFEGEKSCMYATQWGMKNVVSTQGMEISPLQIHKLIALDKKIIFVFDKNVPASFFNKYKNQLRSRVVDVIIDTMDVFDGKESPVDRGKETFMDLIDNPLNRVRL